MKTYKINKNDKGYPFLLKEIYSAPEVLNIRGDPSLLNKTCISIVGTRNVSEYGEYITKKIVKELSLANVVIVSGLAKGVDSIAHTQALKRGLKTIAVLGHGLNFTYPRENISLYEKISQNGALVSEYSDNVRPTRFTFPARNQIISGLSSATIVVEAPYKSGSLITARAALEQGRDVFAVPGDVDRENSLGCLMLMQNGGAYPISSGKEVLKMLNLQLKLFEDDIVNKGCLEQNYNLTSLQKDILKVFVRRRLYSFEEILNKMNINVSVLLKGISELEIYGLIKQKNGKYGLLI